MDSGVKVLCGCAVALVLAGETVARLSADDQRALLAEARGLLAGGPASQMPNRPSSAPQPDAAVLQPPGVGSSASVALPKNRWGQYDASVEIEGQRIPMMVDTGATFVSLSYEDAERLGFRPMPADFTGVVNTANGSTKVARITLREVRLGPIVERNVPALVGLRGTMSGSLLGMTFLGRLGGVKVEDGRLALQQ